MLQTGVLTSILIIFWSFYIAVALVAQFYSYHDHFMQEYTIININCQHNVYIGSIKMNVIGRKLGKCQKA